MSKVHERRVFMGGVVCLVVVTGWSLECSEARAQEKAFGQLEFVGVTSSDGLEKVTSVEVSEDGKFLYASAWQAATITVFRRDAETGELAVVQEVTDPVNLQGATAVRLSPDGRLAAANAFSSKAAVLYSRNQRDGKLTRLDVARNNLKGVTGLTWAIDVEFSPDSKFVYVIDSNGATAELGVESGSVTVFRISDEDKLEFVEAGQDSGFANARGIAIAPEGDRLVVVSSTAGTLIVLSRHAESGKTSTQQVLTDEKGGIHGLAGAMGVAMSPDGRFVYVSSGRFTGDHAIGAYGFDDEGDLSLVQELINDDSELTGFEGGNEITVSPDGRNVYAVASKSNALSTFARDPETGVLTFIDTIPDEQGRLSAVAGVCVSPDGKFVYAAAEQSGMVSIFKRNTESP